MVYYCKTQDTVTPIELSFGDVVYYTLSSGFTNKLELLRCSCHVVETNKRDLRNDFPAGGTVLKLICEAKMNNIPVNFVKYIGSQESFYEPYVINGMQIWLDNAKCLFETIPENHGECGVKKDVRFVLHDNTLPICPQPVSDWCDLYGKTVLDIGECYNGDDCYLGAYNGSSAHGGLDINQPKGTPIYAPIDIDDQCYFQSLENGDVNNRWKMIRHWDSNRTWALQVHHIGRITIKEHIPVMQGTQVADGALVHLGCHPHSHFVFRAYQDGEEYVLDPWIIFRQILKNKREFCCGMQYRPQIITGEKNKFSVVSQKDDITCLWRFGDGSSYCGNTIEHIFTAPGVYAVELLVSYGEKTSYSLEYVTVSGNVITTPRMAIFAEEKGFVPKQPPYIPNYGQKEPPLNTIDFAFHNNYNGFLQKKFTIVKIGQIPADVNEISFSVGSDAVAIKAEPFTSQELCVTVNIDTQKVRNGELIRIDVHSNMLNGYQTIWLKMRMVETDKEEVVICSCKSKDFYCCGYDFVGHKFVNWYSSRGYDQFYLTDGGEKNPDSKAVFQPVLRKGRYQIEFCEHDILKTGLLLFVKVIDDQGEHCLKVDTRKTLKIGTFLFSEGNSGRVELISEQSTGIVLADALKFIPIIAENDL